MYVYTYIQHTHCTYVPVAEPVAVGVIVASIVLPASSMTVPYTSTSNMTGTPSVTDSAVFVRRMMVSERREREQYVNTSQ